VSATPILSLQHVVRRFQDVVAVDSLSLELYPGEFVTLLGPSGCGKTTALRLMAGFETPDAGQIYFKGEAITAATPQQRGFGMVFQNYALFPHLNVFENVAFGLRSRGRGEPEIRDRVARALERVDLTGYGTRAVQALSGGQQQRVALARALAIEPPLLLLDEPLSNLDQSLRARTRTELRTLVRELGVTALFVTHDQEEAFDLSDRIAVMRSGKLCQIGTPRTLYDAPADRFVAGFVGSVNEIPVQVAGDVVTLPSGVRWPAPQGVAGPGASGGAAAVPGGAAPEQGWLLLRPERLRIALQGDGTSVGVGDGIPPWDGVVVDHRFRGATSTLRVQMDGFEPLIDVTVGPDAPHPGTRVALAPATLNSGHLFFD
jgi:ABC-type Fe3+/spermidine/putrescine transport system ATPase subunit